jgi:beta-glucosidase
MEKRIEDNPAFAYYYPDPETDAVTYGEGVFVGYRGFEKEGTEPQFPFGFGLSYTEFKYSGLEIKPVLDWGAGPSSPEALFEVSFELENTGRRRGADVAQIYITSAGTSVPRPPKELKGFAKVELEAGEKRRVDIRLKRRDFCYYDTGKGDWAIETGDREILVGRSSAEIVLRGKVTLASPETGVP